MFKSLVYISIAENILPQMCRSNTNLLASSSIDSWVHMADFFANSPNKAKIKVSARWDFCVESLGENSSPSSFLLAEFISL